MQGGGDVERRGNVWDGLVQEQPGTSPNVYKPLSFFGLVALCIRNNIVLLMWFTKILSICWPLQYAHRMASQSEIEMVPYRPTEDVT